MQLRRIFKIVLGASNTKIIENKNIYFFKAEALSTFAFNYPTNV